MRLRWVKQGTDTWRAWDQPTRTGAGIALDRGRWLWMAEAPGFAADGYAASEQAARRRARAALTKRDTP